MHTKCLLNAQWCEWLHKRLNCNLYINTNWCFCLDFFRHKGFVKINVHIMQNLFLKLGFPVTENIDQLWNEINWLVQFKATTINI